MKVTPKWKTLYLRHLATTNYGKSPAGILADDGNYPVVGTGGSERTDTDFLYDGDSIILGRKGTIDRSPDCESNPAGQGEWGILKTTAVAWKGYDAHENKALPTGLDPMPHLQIKNGDLLMTRAGPNSRVGVVSYVYSTRSKLMFSDKIYRLVPTREVDARFLCYALSSSGSQRHLSNLKTGMAESQANISQKIVKSLLTVCPPIFEQTQIADRIDHVSVELRQGTEVLDKLRSLKTALMQDLLTGRKRVTDLLDEAKEVPA